MAAYAYEIMNKPIMTDSEFDTLNRSIDLSIATRRPDLDKWFKENWSSNTGAWIWKHPDLERIAGLVEANNESKDKYDSAGD